MARDIVALSNWWPWCSKASISTALEVGYRVHVIVSDCQNDPPAEPFLEAMKTRFPGRVGHSRDSMPRPQRTHHCCTRYDYLPGLMEHYGLPILVTDADVMHRHPLDLPDGGFDVACARWPCPPFPWVEEASRDTGQPLVFFEAGLWFVAGGLVVNPTEAALGFARRCRHYIADLERHGAKGVWCSDQLAILAALRQVDPGRIHRLNRDGCEHICMEASHPDHAIWLPRAPKREGEWAEVAATYANGPRPRIDF